MLEATRKPSGANTGLSMDLLVSLPSIKQKKGQFISHVGLEQSLSKTSGKYCVGDEVITITCVHLYHSYVTGHNG